MTVNVIDTITDGLHIPLLHRVGCLHFYNRIIAADQKGWAEPGGLVSVTKHGIRILGDVLQGLDHHRNHLFIGREGKIMFLRSQFKFRQQPVYGTERKRSLVRQDGLA
jgi:hypothetical protein